MSHAILSTCGQMKVHCIRLHRGDDLMLSVKAICQEKRIAAGVILSAVGCISQGRVRDASGVAIRQVPEHCEIVSLNGTVSEKRCHLHMLSKILFKAGFLYQTLTSNPQNIQAILP